MAKPWIHAKSSARKWGGKPEDYMHIHDKMDSTKSAYAGVAHRVIFHSAFGVFLIEEIFGKVFTNSADREVSVRDVAEQHVIEDLGSIPSLDKWLSGLPEKAWMMGITRDRIKVVD